MNSDRKKYDKYKVCILLFTLLFSKSFFYALLSSKHRNRAKSTVNLHYTWLIFLKITIFGIKTNRTFSCMVLSQLITRKHTILGVSLSIQKQKNLALHKRLEKIKRVTFSASSFRTHGPISACFLGQGKYGVKMT